MAAHFQVNLDTHALVTYGEFAGGNIQKRVAISGLPTMFVIFDACTVPLSAPVDRPVEAAPGQPTTTEKKGNRGKRGKAKAAPKMAPKGEDDDEEDDEEKREGGQSPIWLGESDPRLKAPNVVSAALACASKN